MGPHRWAYKPMCSPLKLRCTAAAGAVGTRAATCADKIRAALAYAPPLRLNRLRAHQSRLCTPSSVRARAVRAARGAQGKESCRRATVTPAALPPLHRSPARPDRAGAGQAGRGPRTAQSAACCSFFDCYCGSRSSTTPHNDFIGVSAPCLLAWDSTQCAARSASRRSLTHGKLTFILVNAKSTAPRSCGSIAGARALSAAL